MTIEEMLKGESKTVEFKESLPTNKDKYIKSVVGFANASGGSIIFGVEDETRIVKGIPEEVAFQTVDAVTNAISDSCTPQIIPNVSLQNVDGKMVVIATIYPGVQRPYYITSQGKEKGTYIRTSGTTRHVDSYQLRELEFEGSNRFFDQTYCVGKTVAEDDIQCLCEIMKQRALNACKTDEERSLVKEVTKGNLISWGLLVKREDEYFPTNAFVLLTENDFPQAKIQCAVFKGKTRSEFVDKREYEGPIYEQIEEAYQFVLRNIHYGAKINGLYRVDSYELPTDCIRELICNAVTHRSYLDESCIQIALFDDRLEITSPGMLFGGLTLEDIKEGRSKPRNRGIAYAFAAMKIIEKWGTGIPRIIQSCKDFGIQEPEFIELGMDIRVNLYRENNVDKEQGADKVPISADKVPISADKILSNEEKVIDYLKENDEITNKVVQELCGIKDTASKNLLRKMVEKKLLTAIGEKKSRVYKLNS